MTTIIIMIIIIMIIMIMIIIIIITMILQVTKCQRFVLSLRRRKQLDFFLLKLSLARKKSQLKNHSCELRASCTIKIAYKQFHVFQSCHFFIVSKLLLFFDSHCSSLFFSQYLLISQSSKSEQQIFKYSFFNLPPSTVSCAVKVNTCSLLSVASLDVSTNFSIFLPQVA